MLEPLFYIYWVSINKTADWLLKRISVPNRAYLALVLIAAKARKNAETIKTYKPDTEIKHYII